MIIWTVFACISRIKRSRLYTGCIATYVPEDNRKQPRRNLLVLQHKYIYSICGAGKAAIQNRHD